MSRQRLRAIFPRSGPPGAAAGGVKRAREEIKRRALERFKAEYEARLKARREQKRRAGRKPKGVSRYRPRRGRRIEEGGADPQAP